MLPKYAVLDNSGKISFSYMPDYNDAWTECEYCGTFFRKEKCASCGAPKHIITGDGCVKRAKNRATNNSSTG